MQRQRVYRFLRSTLAVALSAGILMSSTPLVFAAEADPETEPVLVEEMEPASSPAPTVLPETEPEPMSEQVEVTGLQVKDYWLTYDANVGIHYYDPIFTLTFSDGHVTEPVTGCAEYQGIRYFIDVTDTQVYGKPWEIGDYSATATLRGAEDISCEFTVHVIESVIQSLDVQDVEILEGTSGDMSGSYSTTEDGLYYCYQYNPQFQATMADGTVVEGENGILEYQDRSYELRFYEAAGEDQSYGRAWGVGAHPVTAELGGVSDTFNVIIQDVPIQSIQVKEVTLVKDCNTYEATEEVDGEIVTYPRYSYAASMTVTMEDGTVMEDVSDISYQGQTYFSMVFDDQSYANQWDVGSHQARLYILGEWVDVPVNILDSLVDNVWFDDIMLQEGSFCDEVTTPEGTYNRYTYWPQGVVTLKDGTEVEFYSGGFDYNGNWYFLEYTDDQSVSNPWGVGEHEVEFTLAGYHGTFTVNIVDTMIQSVQVEDVVLQELSSGEFVEENGTEYWRYALDDFEATFTMKDGSTETVYRNNYGLYYNGEWYDLQFQDGQSAATPWDVGEHQVTATIMGYSFTFTVTVEEGLAKSLEVQDMVLIQNDSGEWSSWWDETEYKDYWHYEYVPRFTVTLQDGTVLEDRQSSVFYDGQWHKLLTFDDQSGETPWEVGTHQVRATLMGQVATFQVTIVETPVDYISADIMPVVEGTCGYETWGYDENNQRVDWYCYNEDQLAGAFTIHLKDGTQLKAEAGWVEYMGESFRVEYSSDQSYENQWLVGGTYDMTATVMGYTTTIQVKVVEREDVPFAYSVQNGGVYIDGYEGTDENVVIPDTISGMPVVAVFDLGNGETTVKTLTVPDGVKTVSMQLTAEAALETLYVGSGASYIHIYSYDVDLKLKAIHVSEDNPEYASVDGVLYDKEVKTLVYYPLARGNTYEVPDSVENIELLFQSKYSEVNPIFTDNSAGYVQVDGVLYDKEMTTVFRCDRAKSGTYDMPDTVTEIAYSAFENCDQLTSVNISDKVTCIVYSAFASCASLESVTMPDTVTEISGYAFAGCDSLEGFTLPNQLQTIGNAAFQDSGMTSVAIPDEVETIGSNAFANTPLALLDLGNGVEQIGYKAFTATLIREVDIPDSVLYLGGYTFAKCDWLTQVTFGSGLTSIPGGDFSQCGNLDHVTLPKNITWIGSNAFAGCANLANLEILGENVYLGNSAFEYSSLANYTPGSNLRVVGQRAFGGTKVQSAVLGKSVTSIGYGAFEDCTDLGQITVPQELLDISGRAFANTKWYNDQPDGPVYLQHILYSYKGEMPAETNLDIRSGTLTLADYALSDQDNLVAVVLPQGLLRIGQYAFANDSQLQSVKIPLGVTEIGDFAFKSCSSLKEITIPRTVTQIDWEAFYECSGLTIYGEAGSYAQQFAQSNNIRFEEIPVMEDSNSGSGVQVSVPEDTFEEEVTLVTNVVEAEEDKPDITYPESVTVTNSVIVDISFQDQEGVEVQPKGEVTVSIPVPDSMDGEMCTVYHVLDDGTVEEMNAVYMDGCMVFTTDRFSYYVLAQVEPAGTTVSGAIAGGLSDVTVELYGENGELVGSVTGDKSYALENVLAGTYTLKVSKTNYVTREYQITVAESAVELDVAINLIGDINGDGKVNTMDVSQVNGFVKRVLSLSEYQQACANVNGDGAINTMDVSLVNTHAKGINTLW